jgi:predicted O-methyltransferase YrrM
MNMTDERVEEYCKLHTTGESPLLQKINRDTQAKVLNPRMLSGHLQGRLLSMISKMIQPQHILEIGTYTGYSALCLAEGLTEEGKLLTIEKNAELEDRIRNNFSQSLHPHKIELMMGNATEIIPQLKQKFQLVFIDADKENYLHYFNLVFDKVVSGGYILADNVLWSGKVLEKPAPDDLDTQRITAFNDSIVNDDKVECIMLPVRDGLTLIRKK